MKITSLVLALLLAATAAYAQFNGCPPGFCPGLSGGAAIPLPTGKMLQTDGTSFILQTDGTSKMCRAGGC